MKRIIVIISAILLCALSSFAQDIITLKDGTDIEAKVQEVGTTEIKYLKYSNLAGPQYSVNKSTVLLIRYENGEKDIFSSSQSAALPLASNLSYNELKEHYSYKDYTPANYDRFSPALCGVASALVPGLGQALCEEWGRFCGFFFGQLALSTAAGVMSYVASSAKSPDLAAVCALTAYAAVIGIDVWSIIDAVRVAKVKDLYLRDAQGYALDIRLSPVLAYAPVAAPTAFLQPTIGLGLSVRF